MEKHLPATTLPLGPDTKRPISLAKWDMDGHRMPPFTIKNVKIMRKNGRLCQQSGSLWQCTESGKMSKTQHMQDLEIAHLKMGKSP
jgi:hypothetical protein